MKNASQAPFIYTPDSTITTTGTAGNSVTPSVTTGGGTINYFITSSAISGISINSTTGKISWTNAVTQGTYNLTVKAQNEVGNTSKSYKLKVLTTFFNSLGYLPNFKKTKIGTADSSVIPSLQTNASNISYSLVDNANASISIISTTGKIFWNNNLPKGAYTLTIKVIYDSYSLSTPYTIYILPNIQNILNTPQGLFIVD